MTSPGAAPEPRDPAPSVPEDAVPADAAPSPGAGGALAASSAVPEQSPEDTDAAWGEYRQQDDDRLYRDRPPHWDDF